MWNNANKKPQSYPNNSFVPSGRSFEEGEVVLGSRINNRVDVNKEEGEVVTPAPTVAPSFSNRSTSNSSFFNDGNSTKHNTAGSSHSNDNEIYGYSHGGQHSQRPSFNARQWGGQNYLNNTSNTALHSTSPSKGSPAKFGSYASLSEAVATSDVGAGDIGVPPPHTLPHWEQRKRLSIGAGGGNRESFDHRRSTNTRPWETPRGSPPGRGRFGRFDHSYNKHHQRSNMTWDRRSSIGSSNETTPGRQYYGPLPSGYNDEPSRHADKSALGGTERLCHQDPEGSGSTFPGNAQSVSKNMTKDSLSHENHEEKRLEHGPQYDKTFTSRSNMETRPFYHKPLNDSRNEEVEEGMIDASSSTTPSRKKEADLVTTTTNEVASFKSNLDGKDEINSESTSNNSLSRIKCSALGDEKGAKALKVIQSFPDVFSNHLANSNTATVENVYLPSSDQTHNLMLDIESKIETKSKEISDLKSVLKKSIKLEMFIKEENKRKEEEKQQQLTKQQKLIEKNIEDEEYTKCPETIKINEMQSTLDELTKSLSDLDHQIKVKDNLIHIESDLMEKRLDEEYLALISSSQSSIKDAEEILVQASKAVNSIEDRLTIAKVQGLKGMNTNDDKTEVKSSVTSTVSQNLQRIFSDLRDEPADINELISTIISQNRSTAQDSHNTVISSLLPKQHDQLSPTPPLISEDPTEDDLMYYNQYWSAKAAAVSGFGDALYVEPSSAPLHEKIKADNKDLHLLVREYVRDNYIKLHHNWTELAEEYAVRQQIYTKECGHELKDIHSADMFGGSFSILGQRRGAGGAEISPQPAINSQDSGKSRGTNNPYRRSRRSVNGFDSGIGGSDIVRSDYEQEQIIAQLTAQAVMEKRIKEGRSDLPRQVGALERKLLANFIDDMSHRRILDPVENEQQQRLVNPWTDMEKCIFFDRFLQHPKDFRKIASFLKNKTTHDCISFYYVSKQTVPYKTALREHLIRKKRRGEGVSWEATIQSALSLGATVSRGYDVDRPLIFHLPLDDNSFRTKLLHPLHTDLFDPMLHEISYNNIPAGSRKRKTSSLEKLFFLEPSERKLLRPSDLVPVSKKSSSDLDSMSSERLSRPISDTSLFDTNNLNEPKRGPGRRRGAAAKWTEEEKESFFRSLDINGRKWEVISESVETKTPSQVRNFYYDNKKYFDRMNIVKDKSQAHGLTQETQTFSPPLVLQGFERFYQSGVYGQQPINVRQSNQENITMPIDRYLNLPIGNPISVPSQSWDQIAFFMEQKRQQEQQHLFLHAPNADSEQHQAIHQRQVLLPHMQTPPWIINQIYTQRSDVIRDMMENSSINNYNPYNQFQQQQKTFQDLKYTNDFQDCPDKSTNDRGLN